MTSVGLFETIPLLNGGLFILFWCIAGFSLYPFVYRSDFYKQDKYLGKTAIVLGLGFCISSVVFATIAINLNWIVGVRVWIHVVLFVCWMILGICGIILSFRHFIKEKIRHHHLYWLSLILCIFLLVVILLAMIPYTVVPYTGSDDHKYHITILRLWFQDASLSSSSVRTSAHFCFPLLASQVAGIFVPILGLGVAKSVQLGYLLSSVLLLYGVLLNRTKRFDLSFIGATCYAILPIHFQLAEVGAYSDRALAALCFSSLSLFTLKNMEKNLSVILGLILVAGAAATKHQGIFLVFPVIVGWIIYKIIPAIKMRKLSEYRWGILASIVLSLVIVFPWYGRAYLETGNPIFPVKSTSISSYGLDIDQALRWTEMLKQYDFSLEKFIRMFYSFDKNIEWGANNGLLLILMPIVIVALYRYRDRMPFGWKPILFCILFYFVLSIPMNPCRYRTFLYTVHAAVFLITFFSCYAVGLRRRGVFIILLLALIMSIPNVCYYKTYYSALRYSIGNISQESWIRDVNIFHGKVAIELAPHLSETDRVAMTFDRPLYYPGRIIYTKDWEYATEWALPLFDWNNISAWFEGTGVDAVVLYKRDMERDAVPDYSCCEVFETEHLLLLRKNEVLNKKSNH